MGLRGAFGLLLAVAACGPRPQPAISAFEATPQSIGAGDSAQLVWKSVNASGCSISPGVGSVSASGTISVTPAVTTLYGLSCETATAEANVVVQQPVKVDSFTASPAMTTAGLPVVLTWAAHDATSCFITELGTVAQTGTRTVFPMASTTWQFTCEGFRGPAFALATTEVPPAALTVPTEPAAVAGDGKLTLSWKQGAGKANVYFARATGVKKANVATLAGGQVFANVQSPLEVAGLVNGVTYFFSVTAIDSGFETAESAEASGTPVGGPPLGDPYLGSQWHLTNSGQRGGTTGEDIRAAQAWAQGFKGEGVRVAVVDEGVDFNHEDLAVNISAALSYDYLGNAPLSLSEHGTCVAGLVAARDDNGIGMRGVAPRSNLVSYNLLQDLTTVNELDAMVRGKATNGVSTNSWGDADDGTGLLSFPESTWLQGVAEGTQTGRGGLGTVYVWAAGNGGDALHVDNANYDGQTNSRYVLSVAGVGDDGRKVTYSEDGANVLVAAPTMGRAGHGLSTTDLTGSLGYNTGSVAGDTANLNYTDLMDGTSGSTPIVAGIAALLLQVKPQLTWRDVRRVLAYSARKNDPTDVGWATNLAGLHVNHKYGFGVADASAAVTIAKTFTAGAPELSTATALVSPAAAIPDNNPAGASSAITVTGSAVGHIEFIEVTVSISHPRSGDLEILLDRGSGPPDVLAVPHSCERNGGIEQCSPVQSWTFGTVRHLDEVADGTWTLRVNDRQTGNTGTLQSWKLKFWGRP
jgi:proprotein convertase subtilisin/kexin type 2